MLKAPVIHCNGEVTGPTWLLFSSFIRCRDFLPAKLLAVSAEASACSFALMSWTVERIPYPCACSEPFGAIPHNPIVWCTIPFAQVLDCSSRLAAIAVETTVRYCNGVVQSSLNSCPNTYIFSSGKLVASMVIQDGTELDVGRRRPSIR